MKSNYTCFDLKKWYNINFILLMKTVFGHEWTTVFGRITTRTVERLHIKNWATKISIKNKKKISTFFLRFKEIFHQSKMKIFQTVQEQLAIVGICSSNQSIQKLSFNKRIVFGFFVFGCQIVSHFVYTFHVANEFMEYMQCICATSGSILILIGFTAIVFGKAALFESINNIEQVIDSSECAIS